MNIKIGFTHKKKCLGNWQKKGIDFYYDHSKGKDEVGLSFYGGEPLLNFELIKRCVYYANALFADRKITYTLTTNGTLLDSEKAEFIAKEKIDLMFSLDGPCPVHNKHRKFAFSQKGSFDLLYKNVRYLKDNYPDYFASSVQFNAVIDPANGFDVVARFFKEDELTKDALVHFSPVSENYLETKIQPSEDYVAESQYELFKIYLSKFRRFPNEKLSIFSETLFSPVAKFAKEAETSSPLEKEFHHSGPCMPGVTRLFLNADGNFFPCERVSETSSFAKLGNIDEGIDLEKATALINLEKLSSSKCQNCWAYRNCSACIRSYDGLDGYSSQVQENACRTILSDFDAILKNYAALKDLGYDFIPELLGNEERVAL